EKSKSDYGHHSWGNGAYYMETWGIEALRAGRNEVAEEALLEALAHDPGSVRAAMGLQILCERLARIPEARRYALLAERAWRKADPQGFAIEMNLLRGDGLTPQAEKGHSEIPKHVVNRAGEHHP